MSERWEPDIRASSERGPSSPKVGEAAEPLGSGKHE
jgi:hypothetical protein